jgi:hypothetical protein
LENVGFQAHPLRVFSSGDGPDFKAVAQLWSKAPDSTGTMSATRPFTAA